MEAPRRKCACFPPLLFPSHAQLPPSILLPSHCGASPRLPWPSLPLHVAESVFLAHSRMALLQQSLSPAHSLSCVTPIMINVAVIFQFEQSRSHTRQSEILLPSPPVTAPFPCSPFRRSIGRTVSVSHFSIAKFSGRFPWFQWIDQQDWAQLTLSCPCDFHSDSRTHQTPGLPVPSLATLVTDFTVPAQLLVLAYPQQRHMVQRFILFSLTLIFLGIYFSFP